MNSSYKYRGAPEARAFGPLPQGDYSFVVTGADAPYYKNAKWILSLKLTIQPQGVPVFANPWSGIDKNGEDRDGIAEFLLAVNRTPAVGEEPEWGRLIGAKGTCRLKIEISQQGALAGKDVNKVSFFHRPRQLPQHSSAQLSRAKPSEVEPSAAQHSPIPKDPDLDVEPDDIPF